MPRLLLALLCTALCAMVGCGDRSAAADGIHLVWATMSDESGLEHRLIARFEQSHPGVRVQMLEMPAATDTVHNQYATYLVSEDDTIDVYTIDVVWPAEFASAGWALPLDDRFTPQERARFLPGPIQACTYKGHIYAIPWYVDAGMLYYRKDLLAAAHIAPPRTWKELVTAATRLRTDERDGYVFQGAQYEGLICGLLELIWGNGGTVLDEQGNLVLDTPQNVAALQFLIDCVYKTQITPSGVKTMKEDEANQTFRNGRAVFMRSWPYVWAFTQRPREPLLGKIGVVPVPHSDACPKSAACLGGWNVMISRYSRHPDEAWQFASFMTSPQAQKERFMARAMLPSRESVYQDPEIVARFPHCRQFLRIFQLARPRPVTPYYSKLSDILQIQAHKALSQEIDAATALRKASEEMRRIPGLVKHP